MGGRALKNTFTRRYNRAEYDIIIQDIVEKAKTLFSEVAPTQFYRKKESFGDADVLCLIDKPINVNIKDWLIQTFNSKEVFHNGNCYSFEYQEFQVDFILVGLEDWETSKVYYSYNDLFNFVGKIAHQYNLKFGADGLKFVYYHEGKKLGKIYLTKDHHEALTFLGFDPARYDKGFDTLEEVFEYVVQSKYFNPWIFDLEHSNKINRDRDKKRTSYNAFIEYIKPYKENAPDVYYYFHKEREVYLGLINYIFTHFFKEYNLLSKKEQERKLIAAKFNGDIVKEHFNLTGKTLGDALKKFYASFPSNQNFYDYILDNETEVILTHFKTINNDTIK